MQHNVGHEKDIKPNTDTTYVETYDEAEKVKDHTLVADSDARDYVDPTLIISDEESKRLRRKIHTRVLPIMCIAYITQSLDKGTLGTASIMGWQAAVGAKGQDYALTSTLLWCGIILGEPFANQAARRLPLAKVLGVSMLIWSSLIMGLGFSLNIPAVLGIRFLLGFFESLFGPVLLSITVQWYLKQEQAFASSVWQCMLGASGIVSALMGYGFSYIQSKHLGIYGWQWLHITVSLFSFIAGTIVLLFLPDSPTRARWATEDEKVKFVERVRTNDQGIKQKVWRSEQAWEAVRDPYTYLLFGLAFSQTLVVGGLGHFDSLLINKAFGFDVLTSQLLNIPKGAMVVITYMLMAWLVTKTKNALLVMIGFTVPNIIGTVVLLTVAPSAKTRGGLVVAFYVMQCFQACNPSIFLMLSRNSAGQTKKSITYAVTYVGWAGGNAISPQIFQDIWAPRYLTSLDIHLGLYGVFIVLCLVTRRMLVRRNQRKEAAQAAANEVNMNSRAFEDLTDIENPDFRYSL